MNPSPSQSSGQSSGRVFIGIPFAPETRASLLSSLKSISLPGRVTPPEKWHITLCFLGEQEGSTIHQVCQALNSLSYPPTFMLRLDSLGAFPNISRPRVVWLGSRVESGLLNQLVDLVQNAMSRCGIPLEDRKFSLHVTLSRLKGTENLQRWISDQRDKIAVELLVSRITLFRSHVDASGIAQPHSYYEILGEFPFELSKWSDRNKSL